MAISALLITPVLLGEDISALQQIFFVHEKINRGDKYFQYHRDDYISLKHLFADTLEIRR